MKRWFEKKWVVVLFRTAVGGFFVLSAVMKLRLPAEEVQALIRSYEVLPAGLTYPAALVLPWVELVPGVLLTAGILPLYSVAAITGMMVFFMALLVSVIVRGIPLEDCGCLGGWIRDTPPEALARDIVLFLMCLPVFFHYWNRMRGSHPD